MKKELTLEQFLEDYDWENIFGEHWILPVYDSIDPLILQNKISRADVKEIIALVNGENDGFEWVGIFLLNNGLYVAAFGSCDYTGWDCQGGSTLFFASSLENAIQFGLNSDQRERLELR